MSEYICIRKCFHNGRLFKPGDKYTSKPEEKIPHHFALAEKYVEQPAPTPRLGTKINKNPMVTQHPSVKAPGKEQVKAKGKEA